MHFTTHLWIRLQGAAVACALLSVQAIQAQAVPEESTQPQPSSSVNLRYQSPLDGYRRYTESGIQPWQQSNQTVQGIGGWKAYAREAPPAPAVPEKAPQHHQTMPMDPSQGGHK